MQEIDDGKVGGDSTSRQGPKGDEDVQRCILALFYTCAGRVVLLLYTRDRELSQTANTSPFYSLELTFTGDHAE